MEAINTLSRFTTTVKSQLNCKQILQNYESLHNLKKYKFTEILVDNVIPMFQHIIDKFYKNHCSGQSGTWVQNQLKLFLWTVICYMELYRKTLSMMNQDDWKFFSRIFYAKEFNLFEYQARTLLDESVKSAKWRDKQDILLYNIIMSDKKAKWNEIAKQLYMNSNKVYLRTSKQCRQRWLNHLDPTKIKSDWDLNQYLTLFQNVHAKGKKWALIVKLLDDRRSQHTIKNKYNSIMRKKLRTNPQLNQQKACQELIFKIHRILQTYHLDPNDQHLFGPSTKLLNSQNRHKSKTSRARSEQQGQKNRIDVFRKKIQKFSSEKSKELRPLSNKKQNKSLIFSKQKKICILPLIQNTQNQRTINKETQEEDQIFYQESFEANDLLRGQDNNLIFNEDFKDLIKQHELDV